MEKVMWAGRFKKELDQKTNDFNSSIRVDGRMLDCDVEGSIAHATMLGAVGILTQEESKKIVETLEDIRDDVLSGELSIDQNAEDVHMFVEAVLTERLGDLGKKLHTARSRNDQVALDIRLYLKKDVNLAQHDIRALLDVLLEIAEKNVDTILPGYTHLQRAQPVTLAHHLLAYAEMLLRDLGRFSDAVVRMNESPLGSCALAGTTHPIDRAYTAELLGFSRPCGNSLDGVSDRDFCVEIAAACALCMTHLSRFAEEIILWTSREFGFMELDDGYSTGSSIMPQKKNSDIAELVRGKTGRVNGNLVALLTILKGLPLAYNKDMQEDKEAIFDSLDTLKSCLEILAPMLKTSRFFPEKMLAACNEGFLNATDCADWLTHKGVPFRTAYKITGELVAYCIDRGTTLEKLSLQEYKSFCDLFDENIYQAVDVKNCVEKRRSFGGPAREEILREISSIKSRL